jgi:hypothetical protein
VITPSLAATVITQVQSATSLLGLLIILITLFTSEQSRALDAERHRVGGPRRSATRRTAILCAALALVTVTTLIALASLAWRIAFPCCANLSEPGLAVFELVFVLLVPLAVWQVGLAVLSVKLRS